MEYKQLQIYFFLALLLGVLALAFFLLLPYMGALLLAGTLGIVFYPLYQRICRVLPDAIASLATILIVILIVLLPLAVFGFLVFGEARSLYGYLASPAGAHLFSGIERFADSVVPGGVVALDIESYARQIVGAVVDNLGSIFSGFAGVFVATFISIFALYYFFKDGERLKKELVSLSPLANTYDEQIVRKLRLAVNTVIRGTILIALIQGVLAGIGFAVFGVPNPALWGSVSVIAALVPAVGTAGVIIPALIYLFFAGKMVGFFGLLAWGVIVVGAIDNVLRPKLIGHGIRIHPLLILLSVLGGLAFFGPLGFLLGPLVVSLLFALVDIYKEEFREHIYAGF